MLLGVFQLVVQTLLAPVWLIIALIGLVTSPCRRSRRPRAPKCVLITGASSGIGADLALRYSGADVIVAITGRNKERMAAMESAIASRGGKCIKGELDVTDAAGMKAFVERVHRERPIDLIIANAGVTEATSRTDRDVVAATQQLTDINVSGVFNTVLPAIPLMKDAKYGQIAIMASLAGYGPLATNVAYSMTKAAVKTYGEALRRLLYRDGIFVNVICPGFVKSPMTDANSKESMPFKVPADAAVQAIIRGLRNDTPTIAFPWQLHTIVYILQKTIPEQIRDLMSNWGLLPMLKYARKRRDAPAAAAAATAIPAATVGPAAAAAASQR